MKKQIALLIFLLTAVSLYSQEDYPKLTIIDNDTLVLFTPVQVDKMNLTFLQLDEQTELNQSYLGEIDLYKENVIILTEQNNVCKEKSIILTDISEEQKEQLEILTSENKKQGKKIKLLKKMRNLYGIGGVILGSVGTYYISLKL